MKDGEPVVPNTEELPDEFVSNSRSFGLVMDGGRLVLNQRFNGLFVAKSRMFVAKSAFVGTLTRYQVMPPAPMAFVCGRPFVSINGGSTVTWNGFGALNS